MGIERSIREGTLLDDMHCMAFNDEQTGSLFKGPIREREIRRIEQKKQIRQDKKTSVCSLSVHFR